MWLKTWTLFLWEDFMAVPETRLMSFDQLESNENLIHREILYSHTITTVALLSINSVC